MAFIKETYIGKGKVFLDGRFMGNVSRFTYGGEEEKVTLPDFTSVGGGNYDSVSRITALNIALEVHDFSAENVSLGLFGSVVAVTAGAVLDEPVTARAQLDRLVPTAFMIDTSVAPVVTDSGGGTTYTPAVDYTVSAAGITPLSTGSISADEALLIDYTKRALNVIHALTNSGAEFELVFEGLNEAGTQQPTNIRVYKVKFGPSENEAVGSDFGVITLEGEALKDLTKTTTGISQFMDIQQALAA